MTTKEVTSIKFAAIAALALGAQLEGGTFAGVITQPDGTSVAVVLLPAKPDKRLKWDAAMAWAEEQDGQLPTRPIAAMLFANVKSEFEETWHWTNEPLIDDASHAWHCYFISGYQNYLNKSIAGAARAVRLIHLVD